MNYTENSPYSYKTDFELKRAIFIYWIFKHPKFTSVLQRLLKFAIKIKFPVNFLLKKTVYGHFVGGETIEKSDEVIKRLGNAGVYSILDYSVEAGKDEKSFNNTIKETIRTIKNASQHEYIPFSVFKPSALTYEWVLKEENKENLENEKHKFYKRLEILFKEACDNDIPLLVDAEDIDYQNIIDRFVEKGMENYNKNKVIVFNTVQMYRKDRIKYLKRIIKEAREKNIYLGIKLVRGAYLEKERNIAKAKGVASPVFDTKEETDKAYNDALRLCMDNHDIVSVFNGTHNVRSSEFLTELMKEKQLEINNKNIYFAQLYGMSDYLSFSFAEKGYNVAKYLPYGPVKQVMPYLIRRAEENSAVEDQAQEELKSLKAELRKRKKQKNGN